MNKYDVIIKPVLTEKSYEGIQNKRYTFKVAPNATKSSVKKINASVEKTTLGDIAGLAELKAQLENK